MQQMYAYQMVIVEAKEKQFLKVLWRNWRTIIIRSF